jgi:hypothetical protein
LNDPTRKQRIFVALTIGIGATLALFLRLAYRPDPVDFDLAWFGARMLWAGRDPYPLAGPNGLFHWNYHLLYPAPALVAAMPLALLAKRPAAYAFTFISAALLGFGITRGSWHRLPILASAAFVDTTLGGQWSSILVAAIFLPTLAAIACVKPQLGLAALVGASSRRAITAALLGTLLLGAISFALVPSWFGEWLAWFETPVT